MKKKKKGRGVWVLPPIMLLVYLLLFPRPGGREIYLRPVWSRQLAATAWDSSGPADTVFPFRAGRQFGYADLEGRLYYTGEVLHALSLAETGFINHGSVPDHIVFMSNRGEFQYSVKSYGYPLLDSSGQYLYSVSTDLSGLKRMNREGEILWSLAFSSPLTAVVLRGGECVLGLLKGTAVFLDSDGEVLFEYTPKGSRLPVIVGADVSEDGKLVALLSGIDPQKLSIISREGSDFSHQYTLDLSSYYRREVRLQFSPNGRFLYFEAEGGLGVLDVRRAGTAYLVAPGILNSLDAGSLFSAASFRTESGSRLILFRPRDTILLARDLREQAVHLQIQGRALVLGFSGTLLRAELQEG